MVLPWGCSVDLPRPQPVSVTPAWGYNGEDTLVTVVGRHFYPQIEVDATGGQRAEVNAGYRVWLEGTGAFALPLTGVALTDYEHVQAVVPAGMEPGVYDLVVEGPTGRTGAIVDAFTVSPTRADRIVVDSETVVYEVNETGWLDVALVDPAGERVLTDLEVAVALSGEDGPVAATFAAGGLEDQQGFATGLGIRGRLGEDGAARVGLSVHTPRTVSVVVSAVDLDSGVAEGLLKLLWEPGSELVLDLALPTAPFAATAGQPFPVDLTLLDQYGNPVPEASELVLLRNACGTWVDALEVHGSGRLDVTLETATGEADCLVDRILSVSGPPGESPEVTVAPGPLSAFEVEVSPTTVTAGEQELNAFVTPVDAFGNLVAWSGTLTVEDTLGGVGEVDCVPGPTTWCRVQPLVAGTEVRLLVEDQDGMAGTSNPYTVLPGPM